MRRRVEEEPEPEPEIVPDHSDASDEEAAEKSKIPAKMGKKKMEKMQAKADRKVQLEAEMREREKREYEEYLKMKEAFSVEEEGFDENPEDDKENKLEVFIQYIKDTKVVVLEDLAAHFKMKTQDTIDRVTTLIEEGKLTGVIDDRGKFIFISQEELEAVSKFITQRGRVSIAELAENSNRLIALQTS